MPRRPQISSPRIGVGTRRSRHGRACFPPHRLRRSPEESTDTAWAIGSIDVFLLLRSVLGWDPAQYSEWLSRTLVDQLLAPET